MAAIETPTGILLGTFTPGTPEWDEARAGLCITATQIAAVMGCSPWSNRFQLWHAKSGLRVPPFVVTPQIEWGNRLEPAVGAKFADEHPEMALAPTGTWRHQDRPWQRATPDLLGSELVEIKTSPVANEWDEGVPLHYYCQAQWQLDTLGLDVCHVAVLIAGHDYREYVVEYDADDAATMRTAAEDFLATVLNGQRPAIDDSEITYNTIRVQPDRYDVIDVQIPPDLAELYATRREYAKAADAEYTEAKSLLLDALGNGRNAVIGDQRIAYRTARENGSTIALQPAR
ncbi:YqaJ viral recombinase family protein [Streptomyces sp. NBC_00335]|uniref:YqaJ viral recombinase family nuclease n=1 Tax=unclassified Streptomyces TaxID=2593676 RepID=UPI002255F72D|nr:MULTISPECIES: YqaJ viral recombinase family protein [unclassified Streptomyces]MCX5407461.1 YqaJ viral recombinase family protein [Streptomyces sp. NBC_00086]